ncbi:MOSC domain protein [Roseovarius sp. TM1035]|uniref:MOSC domain-containing protein n=1 Tax=Roseovarius TaxID=74030 RepID=UPI0001556E95|nr:MULTISPECIES: MOSC domain-containing protein [Roseovarius]AWZ19920.1 MOSC domain protein [Roseovarius sp. AK1035]EDM31440.1 MOSC domain protein [Roseovarius sp. TM1035]MBW4972999.1 MOSC domain-containing protein [Roseovarius mucosus]|tara:strand:- start:2389 stop:2994 length:606 start_codon:yes stop_codon:yes gene_type:complete
MPALMPTEYEGRITWLGRVAQRDASLAAEPLDAVDVTFAGVAGEEHAGLTRPSCSRVISQHPRGTEIRNARQFSVLSDEELTAIAATMGVARLEPSWLGASLVISGIPDLSHLPPSSRLQGPDGVTLVIDMENRPCHLPAKVIETHAPGFGARFKRAALGRRGVTAWVEREGRLALGQMLRLHIPDQPVWSELSRVRATLL